MGKSILKIAAVIFGLLVVGVIILTLSLDGIIKSNIEDTGSNLLQTEVNVEDVSISLFNGEGSIDGLFIQNPPGYADRPAIGFLQMDLSIDLPTLFSDTIVVKNLVIRQPELYVEQTSSGNNLKTLRDNLNSASTGESLDAYLVIDHLLLEEGTVQLLSTVGEERSAKAELERIELTGVGRKGSNTVKETAEAILEPVLEQAVRKAVQEGVLDAVKGEIQDLLGG